jgi:acetyl-CoA synthetase
MSEHKPYPVEAVKVSKEWKERAYIDKDEYEKLYEKSIEKPDKFWAKQAERIDWIKPFTKVKNTTFEYPNVSIKWFEDGTLNVSANCVDRHHLRARRSQRARAAHHL